MGFYMPEREHRRSQVDAATVEIFINSRFMRLDGGLPDGQGTNIRAGLDKAMDRWREPVFRRNRLGPIDQPAMFQLVKDVYEPATGEAAKQQPIAITIRDREGRGPITPTFTVVRAGAANYPSIAIAAPLDGNSDLISVHYAPTFAAISAASLRGSTTSGSLRSARTIRMSRSISQR